MRATARKRIFVLVFLALMLASLACQQAGRIVSDAEATQLALPTATIEVDLSADAVFQVGQDVVVVGGSYGALVPLFASPGANLFSSQVLANSDVTVLLLGQDAEGIIWYEVEGIAGRGWLREENLKAAE